MKKFICLLLSIALVLSITSTMAVYATEDYRRVSFSETKDKQESFALDLYDNYCYVSARSGGIQIFDVSDKNDVKNIANNSDMMSEMQTDGENIRVNNGYLYAGFVNGFAKFSLDEPGSPVLENKLTNVPKVRSIAFSEKLVFVTDESGNLRMIDISNNAFELKRNIPTDGTLGKHRAVLVYENYAFVTCEKGFQIYDISSQSASGVSVIKNVNLDGANINIIRQDNSLIVMSDWGNKSVYIVDLEKTAVQNISANSCYKIDLDTDPRGVDVNGSLLYVGHNDGKINIYDISSIENPIKILGLEKAGQVYSVLVQNNTLFAAIRSAGILLYDIESFAYLNVNKSYNSLPITVRGGTTGESAYDLYIDGIKWKEGVLEKGRISEKIVSISAGTHKIGIALSGSEHIQEYEFSVEKEKNATISLLDYTQTIIETIDNEELPFARVTISNNSSVRLDGVLLTVLYQNDKIVYYSSRNVTVSPNDSRRVTLDVTDIAEPQNCCLKIFLVKSFEEPLLLSNTIVLAGNNYNKEKIESTITSNDKLYEEIVDIDHTKHNVVIGIKKDTVFSKQTVVQVVKPNGSSYDDLDYIDVVTADENGQAFLYYTFTTENVEENDIFNVISAEEDVFGGSIIKNKTFPYIGMDQIINLLYLLETSEETEDVLKDNSELFRVDMSDSGDFYSLDESYRNEILKKMKSKFKSLNEVEATFYDGVRASKLLEKLNNSTGIDTIREVFSNEENRCLLQIDDSLYLKMSDSSKSAFFEEYSKKIQQTPIYSTEKNAEIFNLMATLRIINDAGYLQMGETLNLFADIFNLNGDYNMLQNVENQRIYVHKIMERTDFNSIQEAVATFNSAVVQAINNKKEEDNKPQNGAGAYGGSSSTSSSNSIVSIVPERRNNRSGFIDTEEAEWATEAITSLAQKGVLNGYEDGTFKPNSQVTRAEFATIICNAFGLVSDDQNNDFSDVQTDSWYHDSVVNLYNLGIVNGIGNGIFGAGNLLSREDLAVIAVRAAEYNGIALPKTTEIDFIDYEYISDYAKYSVSILAACGIMVGYNNEFSPKENVTRAMAAKVIYELTKFSN